MASILDSFRDVFGDKASFLKLVVLAIPLYYAYVLFRTEGETSLFWVVAIFAFLLIYGLLIKTGSNILRETMTVMPSLNPFKLIYAALKGFIAILPTAIVSIFLAMYVIPKINIVQWLDITLISLIWLVVISVVLTSFLMFLKNEKIVDAFDMKTISDKSGDLMVGIIFFVIQFIVINLVTIGFIVYTLIVLFGDGPILDFFIAIAIVFNSAVAGHYLAQLQYEIMGRTKNF